MARMALRNPGPALIAQQAEVAALKSQLQDRVDALAMRLGVMNAHVIRLNALGKRLTEMAHINSREFDFDNDPPQGGSESDGIGRGAQVPDLTVMVDDLGRRIDSRSGQFAALENVILGRQLSAEIKPSGRPPREGYGNLVEINHGNGYVTRYAHAARTLVTVGDEVERGQAIAVVGSTGRSTGPHVHFEVVKDGRQIDPMAFVGR